MSQKEEWDVCPQYNKNFNCVLIDSGKWRLEETRKGKLIYGKWLFLIQPKGKKTAPTFGDQRNFFTGLMEAEWRNDNFIFEDGKPRPAQKDKKLEMFSKFFDDVRKRFNEGIPRGLEFYIKQEENK